MNRKQLLKLGVPPDCIPQAIAAVQSAAQSRREGKVQPKAIIRLLIDDPRSYLADPHFQGLARALIELRQQEAQPTGAPIEFAQWGNDVDEASRQQMRNACMLPVAVAAALMPDAHVGYGLPIGGVLACENAVVPYAVGVDIACRMRLSLTDLPVETLEENDASKCQRLDQALLKGTRFGAGAVWQKPESHAVLDEDWDVTAITRQIKDTAWKQLGTSGSGNHFVEWGIVQLATDELGIPTGKYVGLLSHSGSRGAGAQVCRRYTDIAMQRLPNRWREDKTMKLLAWLTLDSEVGQEYWSAMNLMGSYAAANHEVIHRKVLSLAGAMAMAVVENHHNFAWQETHGGREIIVHRKGATPAARGTLGVIPGSMAAPAFVVRGRGLDTSLHSASHGAGRAMSRTAAKQQFRWHMWRDFLRNANVRLLAGGIDEVPGAYKDIHGVMESQRDLVDILGRFDPRIVLMCDDHSPAED